MNKIKIAIIGIGNCTSSLLQGISYYKNVKDTDEFVPGLMHNSISGYLPSDIECVLAYDIDARKVGLPLNKAIIRPPNCTKIFSYETLLDKYDKNYPIVKMGKILDGFSHHLLDYDEKYRIVLSKDQEPSKEDVINELQKSKCQILLNYCPVGSIQATEFYVECCLEAGVSLINNIPVFIASDKTWSQKFRDANLPIIGDDIKSQIGATYLHRTLTQMIIDRGGKINNTRQLNYGGNTDFANMLNRDRLKSKKISKTEAVQSILGEQRLSENDIHIGPSDFVPQLKDNKICDININFEIFGNIHCTIDCKLSVEDSPNSSGCVIDCIRLAKVAMEKKMGGPILPACAYYMKHPPIQMRDEEARKRLEDFINMEK